MVRILTLLRIFALGGIINVSDCSVIALFTSCVLTPVNDVEAAILNGKLYIDGGAQIFWDNKTRDRDSQKAGGRPVGFNRNLISLTLNEVWNWRNRLPFEVLDADQRVPSNSNAPPALSRGALWPYQNSLYLYGGSTSRLNDSFIDYQSPKTEDTVLWRFDTLSLEWSPQPLKSSDGRGVPRLSNGASAVVEDRGLAFYYGGQTDNGTSPDTQNSTAINFSNQFYVFDLKNGSARALPTDLVGAGRADAQMIYIPEIGRKGILVLFGGSIKPIGAADDQFRDTGGKGWYNQTATGEIPPARLDFCIVSAQAPDKTSWNIYMYGGWDGSNKYDDVYILSLPSFQWINAFPGNDEREAHTCHMVGNRMMITIGGYKAKLGLPGPCDWEPNGVALFNMVNMTWSNIFNPSSEKYNISALISSRIGGKYENRKVLTGDATSETGAATVKSPRSNWAGGLEAVFARQLPANSTNSTLSPLPSPSSAPTPLSKQAIIGISIGSAILLLFVTFAAVQVYRIRRAGVNRLRLEEIHAAELEPTTRVPLSAFQELLGNLGKGRNRAALELPGSAPVYTRDRDSHGNPFELSASGENDRNSLTGMLEEVGIAVPGPVYRGSVRVSSSSSSSGGSGGGDGSRQGTNRNSMASMEFDEKTEKIDMNWI
ncbi:unnamed protein product [Tuber aestivum]|uniref:Uncharacterized protein n=1 Tax=Tuber aestivum TaxID=59557 RepID=A0A292PNB5_9PEZI|nr:unnamed protein product [Tuber aestivum]